MNYAKPRPTEYRRPDDAAEQLSDSLDEAVENIQEQQEEGADTAKQEDPDLSSDGGEVTVGFLDETYPKPTDIYHRVWGFETPALPVTIDRFDANTFGFYALNGERAVAIKD